MPAMFRGILLTVLVLVGVLLNETARAQDAAVVVIVKVFPSPGREDELHARYLKQLEFLRKAEPNATFRLHRSAKAPVTFLWYETYPSQSAYDNHLKVAMVNFKKEFGPTPDGLIQRPSASDVYFEIGGARN